MLGFSLRFLRLLAGLTLYGFADALMIRAGIGVDPWTVFAQGWSHVTGWGIGLLTNVIGLLVLLLWIPLRQRPGVGTLVNVLWVGPAIELGLWLVPEQTSLPMQVLVFAAGLILLAVASGIYIGARMGPGPRDGLMTGIHSRTGWPIWVGRTGVEGSVLLIGWLLGGNVGVGTVVFAALIGPLCSVTLPLLAPSVAAARTGRARAGARRRSGAGSTRGRAGADPRVDVGAQAAADARADAGTDGGARAGAGAQAGASWLSGADGSPGRASARGARRRSGTGGAGAAGDVGSAVAGAAGPAAAGSAPR